MVFDATYMAVEPLYATNWAIWRQNTSAGKELWASASQSLENRPENDSNLQQQNMSLAQFEYSWAIIGPAVFWIMLPDSVAVKWVLPLPLYIWFIRSVEVKWCGDHMHYCRCSQGTFEVHTRLQPNEGKLTAHEAEERIDVLCLWLVLTSARLWMPI